MRKPSPSSNDFDRFARRFVKAYRRDVAESPPEMPPYEPCEQTAEELLAEVVWRTSVNPDGTDSLRMEHALGDVWTFGFRLKNRTWKLETATSGDSKNPARTDWLDVVYAQWFRPFLGRVAKRANGF